VLSVERKAKYNGPLSQFPVNRAPDHPVPNITALLYYVHIIYNRHTMYTTWTNLYLRMKPRKCTALHKPKQMFLSTIPYQRTTNVKT